MPTQYQIPVMPGVGMGMVNPMFAAPGFQNNVTITFPSNTGEDMQIFLVVDDDEPNYAQPAQPPAVAGFPLNYRGQAWSPQAQYGAQSHHVAPPPLQPQQQSRTQPPPYNAPFSVRGMNFPPAYPQYHEGGFMPTVDPGELLSFVASFDHKVEKKPCPFAECKDSSAEHQRAYEHGIEGRAMCPTGKRCTNASDAHARQFYHEYGWRPSCLSGRKCVNHSVEHRSRFAHDFVVKKSKKELEAEALAVAQAAALAGLDGDTDVVGPTETAQIINTSAEVPAMCA